MAAVGLARGAVAGGSRPRATDREAPQHSRQRLAAGAHAFRLGWRFPEGEIGASVSLCTAWQGKHSMASVGVIAILNTSRGR